MELALQAVIDRGIQNFQNLILFVVVDLDQRWRGDFAVRDGAGGVGFELRDVEDWVNTTHIRGQLEGDGVGAGMCDDLVRTKIFLQEFL